MSSAHNTPYLHSRQDQNSGMKNMKKLNTPQAKPLKRSLTETHYGNKKSNKDIYNQQSEQKDRKMRTTNPFQRHFSLNTVIKFKNSAEVQRNLNQLPTTNEFTLDEAQVEKKIEKKQKLLEKIPDHRRIRSSSKISSKIIQLSDFFNAKGTERPKQRVKSQLFPTQVSQKEEDLEKLLQLKLKTQSHQKNQNSVDLKSFRNTGDSKDSFSKHNYGLNIPLIPKLSDILSKKEINDSKQIIKQNEEMRKSKNLRPNPKQWQFHNCLVLQKIQLYSTNLKISCEGWVALDHLELKYLRGWNPKVQDDFSPLIRLFIAKIGFDLPQISKFKLNIDKIFIRVNDKHIYQDEAAKRKQKGEKLKGLAPHTILSLKQLITISTITKHNDLIVHSVLALGYLLQLIYTTKNDENETEDPLSSIKDQEGYNVFIKTTELNKLQEYCEYFERECHNVCQDLDLPNTRVFVDFSCLYKNFKKKVKNIRNEVNQFTMVSSSLDASVLFMKCLAEKDFRQMFSYRVYETQVKFQVGWNFWQARKQRWLNSQYAKYRLKAVGGRNNKGNESYIVWDEHRDVIISMSDCKVNMHWKDAERIQHWIQNHISRFSKKYGLHMTFFPTDTQKFLKIN